MTKLVDIEELRKKKSERKYVCEGKRLEDCNEVTVKKYKEAVYFGEVNMECKKEGKGVMLYTNGRVYEGEFVDNFK